MDPEVIYVMGAGRSGSTALGVALDNLPGIFNAGEVFSWFLFGGVPRTEREPVPAFWRRVAQRIPAARTDVGSTFHESLEHHRAILSPSRFLNKGLRQWFFDCNTELVRAVAAESGAEVVVDVSHYPLRAMLLGRSPLHVKVLYIIRDPRDVINALQKPVQRDRPMHPLAANVYCLSVWLLSVIVYRRFPADRRIKVRYEDFIDAPAETVNRVMQRYGMPQRLESAERLATGLMFQGNRLRERPTISIQRLPSTSHLSRFWVVLSTLIQLPVLVLNRYPFRWPAAAGPPEPRSRA